MVEVGQIYRFGTGDFLGYIYARVISKWDEGVDFMVLKPTNWHSGCWTSGDTYYGYLIANLSSRWRLLSGTDCIKCDKKNPCRKTEVLCPGCRF